MAYLFGGLTKDGPSDELWEYNLATSAWRLLEPSGTSPAARFGHTATWVASLGSLVVWSGQGTSQFFDDIWAFDPWANVWRELPSQGAVPAARYGSCAALGRDGYLWISHGFTEDAGRFSDTRSYDFESGVWTDRTPNGLVPVERCLHDCFISSELLHDQLILYGGQTTGVAALGDIWAYDFATGTWTAGPEQSAQARQLYGMAEAGLFGALIFGGGTIEGGFLDDIWYFDDRTMSLEPFETLSPETLSPPPPPRSGASLVKDVWGRDRFLLFGGSNDDGLLDDLWELNVTI